MDSHGRFLNKMAQSGPVPPAHSRRHRTEHHSIDANNGSAGVASAIAAGGRFGETEWEARDVRNNECVNAPPEKCKRKII